MDVTIELWQSNVFLQSLVYSLPKYEILAPSMRSEQAPSVLSISKNKTT